jgi:hypothetical protein
VEECKDSRLQFDIAILPEGFGWLEAGLESRGSWKMRIKEEVRLN